MRLIRQRSKSASVLLIALMVSLTIPYQPVLAAMIETDAAMGITVQGQEARNNIKSILAREDVRAVLKAQGIDPLEARARVDSLTDAEAMRIAEQIEELPAGGDFLIGLLVAVGIIVLVLAITDALGYTDVFTFIR